MMEKMKELVKESEHIVVFGGMGLAYEQGLNGVRGERIAYDIEEEYGLSAEEMMTNLFFTKNAGKFYDYYRNSILNKEKMKPGIAFQAIADMEKAGKLETVITRSVYGLCQQAGVKNVIELHGSVYENKCPRCNRLYGPERIWDTKGVPLCEDCKVAIRPGFALFGDMLDNGKVTQCANAVGRADLLIVAACDLQAPLCRYFLKYFTGKAILLINDKKCVGDEKADYIVYGKSSELLRELVDSIL